MITTTLSNEEIEMVILGHDKNNETLFNYLAETDIPLNAVQITLIEWRRSRIKELYDLLDK